MRKVYTFAIRDAVNGNKLIGGTIGADDSESAARSIAKLRGLSIRRRRGTYYTDHDLLLNGKKIFLSIGIPAEFLCDVLPIEDVAGN